VSGSAAGRAGDALRAALRAEGGTLAEVLAGASHPDEAPAQRIRGPGGDPGRRGPGDPGLAEIAARGPRAAGREAEYELLLEMILEGSRLHYGQPRVVCPEEPDLALLLGDQLYALGLSRLAALGDLEAITELADVISLVAQAQAVDDLELAEAVWEAGSIAVGWGGGEALEAAKALARAGDPRAGARLRAAAFEHPRTTPAQPRS